MIRLFRERPAGAAAFDTAVSRALLERVRNGSSGDSFRLYRPGRVVSFGGQDAHKPGFREAVDAAREEGFEAVMRLAGGSAAVFHEGTVAFAYATADEDPTARTHARFEEMADIMRTALSRLGIDAHIGEVPGEYCPGRYSVNARGQKKIVGIGQRIVAGGAHVGGVVVADGADLVRNALIPVYDRLGLDWDPATAGSAAEETGATWDDVEQAIATELASRHDLAEARIDDDILSLASTLAGDYEPKG